MNYFVTGGTGFLGGYLVSQLLDEGHEVVALARSPDGDAARELADQGAQVVEGDILDPETMHDPMAGVDGVFHVAGWYEVGVDDPTPGERINVEGTRNVLETMDELDVPKGVYTSTLAVNSDTNGQVVDERYRFDGEHVTHYDRTKWEAHHEVAEPMADEGLPLVTVMPGVIYGPGDTSDFGDFWRDYLRGDVPMIPRKSAYCFGHVEDIARAHVQAMEQGEPGEDYIIGGEPLSFVEAFKIAEEITGIPAPRTVSPRIFRMLGVITGIANRVIDVPDDYHPEAMRVIGGVTYLGDNSKAKRELGLEHRPFEEGIREFLEDEMAKLGIDRER